MDIFNGLPSIEDGIYKFSTNPSYWNLLTQDESQEFLKDVNEHGWKKAILQSTLSKVRNLYNFTECIPRADSSFYLNLTRDSVVLDAGSGWGNYSFAISPRVKHVVAADSSFESLRFVNYRVQQDKIENISPVFIDPLDYAKLPFIDGIFDAAIFNGVLEWVGSFLKSGDPLKIQQKCLKEVNRILKNEGQIFIAIENRFGLNYFEGKPDDHTKYYRPEGLKYTTLLPRFISNWISKKHLGVPYRTYTHSLWGIKRMLRKAGFKNIKAYWPDPDYRSVYMAIYPINANEIKNRLKKRLRFFSWIPFKYFLCDSFIIIASK